MGCGCRKVKSSKSQKQFSPRQKSAKRKATQKRVNEALTQAKIKKQLTTLEQKKRFICSTCIHSVQTPQDKKFNLKICHKLNRPLSIIIKDQFLKCPIGSFEKLSVSS